MNNPFGDLEAARPLRRFLNITRRKAALNQQPPTQVGESDVRPRSLKVANHGSEKTSHETRRRRGDCRLRHKCFQRRPPA